MLFSGEFSGQPVKSVLQVWAEKKGLLDNASPDEYQGIAVREFVRRSVGQDISSERVVSSKFCSALCISKHVLIYWYSSGR